MTRLLPSRATTLAAIAIAVASSSLAVLHAQGKIAISVAGLRVVGPGIGAIFANLPILATNTSALLRLAPLLLIPPASSTSPSPSAAAR